MTATLSLEEISLRAEEAYSYLYPLVTMDVTRLKLTDPAQTGMGHGAPNALSHTRSFPPADFRVVVAPNFDTLYTIAWLDLGAGPLLLDVPDSGGRYYLLPLLDMWTNAFAVPGSRTTGTGPLRLALVPAGYSGTLPEGVTRVEAPTDVLWLIGRTQTNGPSDYDAVHAFQDGMRLTTLDGDEPSRALRPSVAPGGLDLAGDPLELVNSMDAVDFFSYGARLMGLHHPQPTDFSVLARMASIGIVPGAQWDVTPFAAAELEALRSGAARGLARQEAMVPKLARVSNGWSMNTDTMGVYGNFYIKRAAVAQIGLGANPPEDAVYPIAVADSAGQPIVGEKDYLLHFDADALPPVGAFWSVTMYDKDSYQAANVLDRFALGDRDPIVYNPDGSLDLYLGPNDPGGEHTANWLPAPAGPLRIIMRLYQPRHEVLDGSWNPPALVAR